MKCPKCGYNNEAGFDFCSECGTNLKKARLEIFASLKSYEKDPSKFQAKPMIPGYTRSSMSIVTFTNQVSSLKETTNGVFLSLAGCSMSIQAGRGLWYTGKYIRTELRPYAGEFELLITTDDGADFPSALEHPERVYGIDPGTDNFVACANNFGAMPFLVNGKPIKALNHYPIPSVAITAKPTIATRVESDSAEDTYTR